MALQKSLTNGSPKRSAELVENRRRASRLKCLLPILLLLSSATGVVKPATFNVIVLNKRTNETAPTAERRTTSSIIALRKTRHLKEKGIKARVKAREERASTARENLTRKTTTKRNGTALPFLQPSYSSRCLVGHTSKQKAPVPLKTIRKVSTTKTDGK